MVAFRQQRVGDGAGLDLGHQDIGRREGVVVPVGVHHDAVVHRDAVAFQHAVQVGQVGVLLRAGEYQQLAAALDVFLQHRALFVRNIAGGRVDEQHVAVLGHGVHVQQGEILHRIVVAALQFVSQGGGEFRFPVAAEQVDLGQVGAHHIVNGRGDLAFAVELQGDGTGGVEVVGIGLVDVVIGDVAALVAGLHHQRVVGHRFVGVLLGEGGVHVGVALEHRDMVGQFLIAVQQLFDDGILLPCLGDPVDGHILVQIGHHCLGVGGEGVELRGGNIELRPA